MNLSEIGKIVENYWLEIPKHFPFVELDEFSIMPNHTHSIIGINNSCRDADLSRLNHARGNDSFNRANQDAINQDAINRVSTGGVTGKNNPMGKNSLGEIVRWYKGRCKFEIGKTLTNRINFVWQPRFYDRIIRNEKELDKIRKYIFENVLKWEFDRNNPENLTCP